MQTLLGAIGAAKSYDIWIPLNDRERLDWSITNQFDCRQVLPHGTESAREALQEIDVVWIQRGSSEVQALFEVEHSTPIYSALLRFNDIHLSAPNLRPRFSIVAKNLRRSLFARQLSRPTFQMSSLSNICTFLEYANVYGWYNRTKSGGRGSRHASQCES